MIKIMFKKTYEDMQDNIDILEWQNDINKKRLEAIQINFDEIVTRNDDYCIQILELKKANKYLKQQNTRLKNKINVVNLLAKDPKKDFVKYTSKNAVPFVAEVSEGGNYVEEYIEKILKKAKKLKEKEGK